MLQTIEWHNSHELLDQYHILNPLVNVQMPQRIIKLPHILFGCFHTFDRATLTAYFQTHSSTLDLRFHDLIYVIYPLWILDILGTNWLYAVCTQLI